jgi:hypothetical protein
MRNHLLNIPEQRVSKAFVTKNESTRSNRPLWNLGVGIGLLGGTTLLFGAIFLTIFEYFYSEKPHGSWLFLAVLPLWIIGAVCLDKIEDAEKADRIEYCKKNPLKDKDGVRGEYIN